MRDMREVGHEGGWVLTQLPARLRWYTASDGLLNSCDYSLAMTPTATTAPINTHRDRNHDSKECTS